MSLDERVAVVGMHVRLPGAIDTCDGFWDLLAAGREVFTRGPIEGSHVALTSHLADAHLFAAEQFGISGFEAELMDPQHRLLLEMSWECLETAGPTKESVTGVFSACSPSSLYEDILLHRPDLWDRHVSQIIEGCQADFLATRIAYRLGLTGPAVHVGSGCSSSLVAVNQAIQALNTFQCDRALVAAASIHSPRSTGYQVRDGGIYSPDGRCRPFADDANGTVPGNGGVVVLLKRLEDAIADDDHVDAVILGSAVNNDGDRKVGFAAPSVDGHIDCIRTALEVAEVEPGEVRYLEAHGTGTKVGDPIELRALSRAYGLAPDGGRFVGSVKANIGHTDVAAGLFGLVKAALVTERRIVPPQINVTVPTTRHDWSDGALRLTPTVLPLDDGAPVLAAVSSLGVGGTNAHLVLREARGIIGGKRATPRAVVRVTGRKAYPLAGLEPAERPAPTAEAAAPATVTDEQLYELFARHTTLPVTSADDDFFALGGDSLGLIYLLDDLNELTSLNLSMEDLERTPTVSYVRQRLSGAAPATAEIPDNGPSLAAEIDARLTAIVPADAPAPPDGPVLLTGATGFVGGYVLATLLAGGSRVVCLLRGGPRRRAELVERLGALGCWDDAYDERLEVVAGDVSAPLLGLAGADREALSGRVSRVIHAAARVNHVYPYARLAEENTHSAANVLAFAAAVVRKQVIFVSTTAVFESAAYPEGTDVPAGPLRDLPPEHLGYSRSKAAAEAYFDRVAELGLSAAVVRIPNVFGERRAYRINHGDAIWSWARAILLTGEYPASFDLPGDEMFQALPGDVAARVIVNAIGPDAATGCRYINAVPNLVCSSRGFLAGLHAAGHHPSAVPDAEWYARVATLDPRQVWVAGVAGGLADRTAALVPRRLHRFPLDDDPAVAAIVNAEAIWSPSDLAGYLASLTSPERL